MTAALRHNGATQEMHKDMTYLYTRNEVYYFRRRIPADLTGIVDPSRFHFSLGTRDRREAIRLRPAAIAESDWLITKERGRVQKHSESSVVSTPFKGRPPSAAELRRRNAAHDKRRYGRSFYEYQNSDILRIVSVWFQNAMRETVDTYRQAFALNNPDGREEIEQELDEERSYLEGKTAQVDELVAFRAVRAILDEEDCALPPDQFANPLLRKLYGLVLEGLLRLNDAAKAVITTGVAPTRDYDSNLFAADMAVLSPNGQARKSITLDELIEQFDKSPRREHLRKATRAEYTLIYRLLREQIGGSTPIREIYRPAIREVAETLRYVPSRATLKAPKTPLRQLAADAKLRGLPQPPPKTYNKKVQQISALFAYALTEQLLEHNPATKLSLPEPPKSGDEKGFSAEELNAIFAGDFFTQFLAEPGSQFVPNHRLRPCYFWTPLIALFQGFRSGEILQLLTNNVCERDGVMAIRIEGNVKNQQTIRWVPMHPKLREFGFLEYVENARRARYEKLFPDAKLATDGKYSTWFQKPFAKYLKRLGVKKSRDECFHSFRHTWVGELRRVNVPEEIRRRLGGWKIYGAEANYGSESLPRLFEYLKAVEYPGLNLSALRAAS